MEGIFSPERLAIVRKSLGINKAEAAKMLNITAMAYGRYENGNRVPSFQTVSFIAQSFGTSVDYLYGIVDSPTPQSITINQADDPELFEMIRAIKKEDAQYKRLLDYYNKIKRQ